MWSRCTPLFYTSHGLHSRFHRSILINMGYATSCQKSKARSALRWVFVRRDSYTLLIHDILGSSERSHRNLSYPLATSYLSDLYIHYRILCEWWNFPQTPYLPHSYSITRTFHTVLHRRGALYICSASPRMSKPQHTRTIMMCRRFQNYSDDFFVPTLNDHQQLHSCFLLVPTVNTCSTHHTKYDGTLKIDGPQFISIHRSLIYSFIYAINFAIPTLIDTRLSPNESLSPIHSYSPSNRMTN